MYKAPSGQKVVNISYKGDAGLNHTLNKCLFDNLCFYCDRTSTDSVVLRRCTRSTELRGFCVWF